MTATPLAAVQLSRRRLLGLGLAAAVRACWPPAAPLAPLLPRRGRRRTAA
jgi:hypothetical protein